MKRDTLGVIARLRAKPEKVDELRSLLMGLIAPTHQEPGCISYEMLQNREDSTEFTFVEEWIDQAALDSHFQTEHIRNALKRFPKLLAGELDLRRYTRVA